MVKTFIPIVMERSYSQKMEHSIRLLIYTHPSAWPAKVPEYECDGMRNVKKANDPELTKRVADICGESVLSAEKIRCYEDSKKLQADVRQKLKNDNLVKKALSSPVLADALEVLCDDIAFHVSEAHRYFTQKYGA